MDLTISESDDLEGERGLGPPTMGLDYISGNQTINQSKLGRDKSAQTIISGHCDPHQPF